MINLGSVRVRVKNEFIRIADVPYSTTSDCALCVLVTAEGVGDWLRSGRGHITDSTLVTPIMSDSSPRRSDDVREILLIEDNPGDARLTQEACKETDCETTIHVVTNGDDALTFLTQQGAYESAPLPDVVLLDLDLPGKDGCAVLEAIRDDPQLSPVPVIMLTSSSACEDIARCYDARANAYLTKPTDLADFITLMKAIERFWFEQVQLPQRRQ